MKKKLGVSAYNIHSGGGLVILIAFLAKAQNDYDSIDCYIDPRLPLDFSLYKKINFIRVENSIIGRLAAEYQYTKILKTYDAFFFLGNLPPLFRHKSAVTLILQNRFYVDYPFINFRSAQTIIKSLIELVWFYGFIRNVDTIQTQTVTLRNLTASKFSKKIVTNVNYFDEKEVIDAKNNFEINSVPKIKGSFIYVCSEEPHKNLKRLIAAFSQINQSQYKELLLTIPKDSSLVLVAHKLNVKVEAVSPIKRMELLKKLYQAEYLIYPSLFETCGLPLMEAKILGTKIISSNYDFSIEACTPDIVFDPLDINSITDAITKACHDSVL